jgi:hypothetical protein
VRDTLHRQIYGVDISKEAVQIAAFSLYLTALELDPDPQPPSALKFRPLIGNNLFANDAFDENAIFNNQAPFASKNFSAIVGNPPWKRTKANRLATEYCKRHEYPLSRDNPDQAFLWRVGDFTNHNTRIGVILHGKPFFSHTPAARKTKKALLTRFKPQVMINLADLRQDWLFPTSDAPAMVLIAKGCRSETNDDLSFVCLERSEAFKRHGIFEIGPENIKRLPVCSIVSDPDVLKVASWGTARDMALIQRLRDMYPTFQSIIDGKGLKKGQGFKLATGQIEMPELYGKKWLSSGNMAPYQIDAEALPDFPVLKLHRRTNPDIFAGPLIIANRGIGGRLFYAAFSQQDVVYDSLFWGIAIPKEEATWGHYLNGILNSSITTYFLFMTASVWGVERDEIQPIDLLRLPMPYATKDNESIVTRIVQVEEKLRRGDDHSTQNLRQQLDEAVFDLYDMNEIERVLVQDAISLTIDLRMKQEKSSALKSPDDVELKKYAAHLISVIQPFLKTLNERTMVAEVFNIGTAPLQVVKFSMISTPSHRPAVRIVEIKNLEAVLEGIARQLPQRMADRVYTRRNLRIYAGDDLYVVKPAQRRYWSRSAGLNDADMIIAEHLGANRDSIK